jgi:predicted enzyme related to lactoylglutathione lyase
VDAVVARALAAGATLEREVADAPYGRTGVVLDPAGHRWMVQTPPDATGSAPAPGQAAAGQADVGYQTLYVPDVERTKSFFAQVLGWTYVGGEADGGWEAEGVVPQTGLMGGAPRPEVQLCFRVDDALEGARQVAAAGGSAQEPQDKPYGVLVECADDQGMRFQLWQPR